jgi:hypothetical protein
MCDSIKKKNVKNRIISWRCPRSKCQTFYSLYAGTFFEQFQKPLFDILAIIKCWALVLKISKTIQYLKFEESELCRQTIGKIFKSQRYVCTISLDKPN